MRKLNYCILNKQYSKEAYEALRAQIIKDMNERPYRDSGGRIYPYGEFFPIEHSPFSYNATVAQHFFPLSKEEIDAEGYSWSEVMRGEYTVTKNAESLPDHIKNADDSLIKEIIGCFSCGRGFRIIATELDFLRKMNLPLPRMCPQCRIENKFQQWIKNLRTISRKCVQCGTSVITNYTKEEAPTILCKACYQAEVI